MEFRLYRVLTIFVVGMVLLVSAVQQANCAQVGLRWDPNDPAPEGYRVFTRTDKPHDIFTQAYRYNEPQPTEAYADGNILHPTVDVRITLPGMPMELVRYFFIVRAYDQDLESADSEEVFWDVDRTPPPVATNLTGSFDKAASEITFTFDQAGDRAKYWKVFYTLTSGQDYVEFETIQNTGQTAPTITKAFTAVQAGQRATVYWVVVGFYDAESFSPNSAELAIDVDRRVINPPANVQTFAVTIPVQ